MESFNIEAPRSVQKDLRKLPKDVLERVAEMFIVLSVDPFSVGAERMTDQPGFKVRVGDYRVRFEVDVKARVVTILRVRHRNEVYKR
jgi:mRNA interferase RelE/StbE